MYQIAVIDRGVETSHRKLSSCAVQGVEISIKDGEVSYSPNFNEDDTGHGTAITGIIHGIVPEMEITAIKLSTEEEDLNEQLLIEGLRWCLDQEAIKVINVSLGIATKTPHQELHEICNRAVEKGKVIIAAAHNIPGFECYPAYFTGVIGVSTGLCPGKTDYGYLEDAHINVLAKGTTRRMLWKDNGYKITSGNSFAAAHFSGLLVKMLNEQALADTSFQAIQTLIRENASKGVYELQYVSRTEKSFVPQEKSKSLDEAGQQLFHRQDRENRIGRLALTGISEKEMKTILDFKSMCQYDITVLVDYPKSMSDLSHLNGMSRHVKRRLLPEDMSAFDTMVMGYFLDQLFDANIIFSIELLKQALAHHKNLILWDENVKQLAERMVQNEYPAYTGEIFCPTVDQDLFGQVINFRFFDHNTPSLSVVGTGNKQGKITTQLVIKKVLEEAGYQVGHIATEPQALLFGADFLFPYGHNSNVFIDEEKWGRFINAAMNGIARYNDPHIILSGTQGLTIPRVTNKIADFSSMHFLSGIQPDAFICTVSPEDEEEVIQNLLQVMKIYYGAKPLFLALTPHLRSYKKLNGKRFITTRLLNQEEFDEKSRELSQKIGCPVLNVKDADNQHMILELIQDFFSGQ